jgi:hypothetical protein
MTDKELWTFWQAFRDMRILIHAEFCGRVTDRSPESCPACAHLAKLDHEFQRHLNKDRR